MAITFGNEQIILIFNNSNNNLNTFFVITDIGILSLKDFFPCR